jgi:hypothetical protein
MNMAPPPGRHGCGNHEHAVLRMEVTDFMTLRQAILLVVETLLAYVFDYKRKIEAAIKAGDCKSHDKD